MQRFHDASPFFSCEGLLAPRAGLANIPPLSGNDPFTTPRAHDRHSHATWDEYKGVFIVCSRMICKRKLTVEFRLRVTVDSGVNLILAVASNICWASLRSESAPSSDVFAHSQNDHTTALVCQGNGCLREGCSSGILVEGQPALVLDR